MTIMQAIKKALITGITGQDGAYLAELLLEKGYHVTGTYRRSSSVNFWRIEELGVQAHPNLSLVEYDLTDLASSIRLIQNVEPDEVYNLAAQSFVGVSFDQPLATAAITGLGAVHLLEAIRTVNPKIRLPGIDFRNVRPGASRAANRIDPLLSTQPVWRGQAVRALDDGQLP